MKHLVSIEATTKPFEGIWMKSAYRVPNGKFPVIERFLSQENDATTPITEMVVNSLTMSPADGQRFNSGLGTYLQDRGQGHQSCRSDPSRRADL